MEGWQKGAGAVLKMSGAGKENYFKNFPERKEWFQANFPEHFGRSAAVATTSLKKVTKAKQQKQRLAIIRQVAEKQNRLKVSSDAVRAMGERRRQSGEGLGGGLETNRDIIAHATAGNYIKSGGLGSLFEEESSANTEPDTATTQNETPKNGYDAKTGMYYYNGVPYNTQKEAEQAEKNDEESKINSEKLRHELLGNVGKIMGLGDAKDKRYGKKKDPNQSKSQTPPRLPPDRSTHFRDRDGTSVDGVTPPPSDEPIIPIGTDWAKTNPDWGANLGMEYPTNRMDTETEKALLMRPQTSAGGTLDKEGNPVVGSARAMRERRKQLTPNISIRANEEYAKQLAEKTIQECMPMPMNDDDKNWDDMKTWQDNPISRMSKEPEAEDEPGEYDYEGDMAKSQLRSIMHNSKMLHDMLEDNTNLPEWVQSKITLAEDYILTASNYMRGELDKMNEEADMGGDLPFDPNAERPEMPAGKQPEQYRYVRGLARKAMKAGIAAAEQPVTHNDLVAQHMDLHQNTQVAEGMSAAVKLQRAFERAQAESAASRERGKEILAQTHAKYVNDHVALHAPVPRDDENMAGEQLDEMDNYDMINRDALPVPPHRNIRGVQDRINADKRKDNKNDTKKQKIIKKVSKALQKKRMALPTDNPSANELVPKSMLPDVPGYPEGYQMEEQVVEQPVEQHVEAPVVEENASPFVSAGSKFLTRTSTRLVYGDKND